MTRLHAQIKPLKGKYYGAKISLEVGEREVGQITVWLAVPSGSDLSAPSQAQLEAYGYSSAQEALEDCFPCDSHYQSKLDQHVAEAILRALNGLELTPTSSITAPTTHD